MNKNFKVITINGIRGIIAAIFVVLGLISGFIISPGWVCMKLWNHFVAESGYSSIMNIYQGIMLWAIIALSLYVLNNKKSLIGFASCQGLTPEQIQNVMSRTKLSESAILKDIEKINNELRKDLQEEKTDTVEETETEEKEEIRR